ncbi:hypothetical protein [Staphylococcus phage PT1-4]
MSFCNCLLRSVYMCSILRGYFKALGITGINTRKYIKRVCMVYLCAI